MPAYEIAVHEKDVARRGQPPRRLACTPFGIAFVLMVSRWARGKLVVGGPEGDVPFRGQERGPVGGVHTPLVFGTRFCVGSQYVPRAIVFHTSATRAARKGRPCGRPGGFVESCACAAYINAFPAFQAPPTSSPTTR